MLMDYLVCNHSLNITNLQSLTFHSEGKSCHFRKTFIRLKYSSEQPMVLLDILEHGEINVAKCDFG